MASTSSTIASASHIGAATATPLPCFKPTLLDLHNHADIGAFLRLFKMELYEIDPPLDQVKSARLLAPKTYSAKSSEFATVSGRDPTDQFVEVVIPRYDNSR